MKRDWAEINRKQSVAVNKEALRLLRVVHPHHNIKHPENFEGWIDGDYHTIARHVLRRIAAAERRASELEKGRWRDMVKRKANDEPH